METDEMNGSCSQTCKNENTTAIEECACKQFGLSHKIGPVIDADRETYLSLKTEQENLWRDYRKETEKFEAVRTAYHTRNQKIEAKLKQFARPECYGNLDNHLKRVSGPAQCEACGHILACYQAQCERWRC